jgi:MFS family permease
VFGFHRAMDHAGAVLGPTGATLFLLAYPGQYRMLFALTALPGAIAVALVLLVRENDADAKSGAARLPPENPGLPSLSRDAPLPSAFTRFMIVVAIFTLGNSTDAFLLLKLTEAAGGPAFIPMMWAALHVVKAGVSIVGGGWSDRIGRRAVIALGWIVYAAVYAGFAMSASLPALLLWFLVYGLYFGLTEGTEKALIADLAPASRRGFAFGLYHAVTGLGALAASLVFGIIWTVAGPAVAFSFGAVVALVSTMLLFVVLPRATPAPDHIRQPAAGESRRRG